MVRCKKGADCSTDRRYGHARIHRKSRRKSVLAILGGSGLTQLANMEVSHRQVVRTPYGDPSGALTFGRIGKRDVVFLARHGYGHTISPHLVNYRANIWALKHGAGSTGIISVASVGGIGKDFVPGVLAVPHQIIDYTWGRQSTFHEGLDQRVVHTDFTEPYDPDLRRELIAAARRCGGALCDSGVYAATHGPRLETAAEVDRLERDGADMVGMTGMPEAALAREAELPYATVAIVANWAAGRGKSNHAINFDDLEIVLTQGLGKVRIIIENLCEAV
jgi:5'-methylthioadenosine phosphorylase